MSLTEYKPLAVYFVSKYLASSFTAVFDSADNYVNITKTAIAHSECKSFFKSILSPYLLTLSFYLLTLFPTFLLHSLSFYFVTYLFLSYLL